MVEEPIPAAPTPGPTSDDPKKGFAIASLVIGIINLCAWFLPICGGPLAIVGIVLGVLGMKSTTQRTLAIVGLVLSALGLIAACLNAAAGIWLGTSGGQDWLYDLLYSMGL